MSQGNACQPDKEHSVSKEMRQDIRNQQRINLIEPEQHNTIQNTQKIMNKTRQQQK
jgi:hypothetical protein